MDIEEDEEEEEDDDDEVDVALDKIVDVGNGTSVKDTAWLMWCWTGAVKSKKPLANIVHNTWLKEVTWKAHKINTMQKDKKRKRFFDLNTI